MGKFHVGDFVWLEWDVRMSPNFAYLAALNNRHVIEPSSVPQRNCHDLITHSRLGLFRQVVLPDRGKRQHRALRHAGQALKQIAHAAAKAWDNILAV